MAWHGDISANSRTAKCSVGVFRSSHNVPASNSDSSSEVVVRVKLFLSGLSCNALSSIPCVLFRGCGTAENCILSHVSHEALSAVFHLSQVIVGDSSVVLYCLFDNDSLGPTAASPFRAYSSACLVGLNLLTVPEYVRCGVQLPIVITLLLHT